MRSSVENRSSQATECLFAPASVAVVGASAEPRKWGHLLARGALAGEHRRMRSDFVNGIKYLPVRLNG